MIKVAVQFISNIRRQPHSGSGYITLIAVLIVIAAGTLIAASLVLLGLGFTRSSSALEKSSQAKSLALACAEQALQEIKNSPTYTGSGNLNLTTGNCSYTVTNQGQESRLITIIGTADKIIRRVKITTDAILPQIHISSWQEVADF